MVAMKRTQDAGKRMTIDTAELQKMLCCGRHTAVKIGTQAEARIQIGSRVLWNVSKIQHFLDSISEGGSEGSAED